MALIDRIDPYAPIIMHRDDVAAHLEAHPDDARLVLTRDIQSAVIVRARPWTYAEAEEQARYRGYDDFAFVNADGGRGMGVLTEPGTYSYYASARMAVPA